MPIFRRGGCIINLPEGQSFVCTASPHCAEWYLCPGMEKGKLYKISCQKGSLVATRITSAADKATIVGVLDDGMKASGAAVPH